MCHAAILDDRSVIEAAGPEARTFLQGLITNDMTDCGPGRALYAGLLTPQGKILFDFLVVEADAGRFLLDCSATRAPELLKRLSLYRLRAKIKIALAPQLGVAASWNDGGASAKDDTDIIIVADPRLAALGLRLIAPPARLQEILAGMTPGDYQAHRLRLGVPDSADLPPDTVFPLDAAFEELSGVDFRKGCYVGQEVTARMKHRATARRRFVIAETHDEWPSSGTPVMAGDRELGMLATGKDGRGLALVRLDRLAEAEQSGDRIVAAGRPVNLTRPSWLRV